jgi:SAM-dependent methyltransferase
MRNEVDRRDRAVRQGPPSVDELVAEQRAYYEAVAVEYERHALAVPGGEELEAALDEFRPTGDVLELACGTGIWTAQLTRHAAELTAVDASKVMLAVAKQRVGKQVQFVHADIFAWRPERRYDVVFFGFWLSHVPLERFESFWSVVRDCLKPDGRVFFVDDGYRTDDELIFGESSSTIRRRLEDGTEYRIVKVAHRPGELQQRLARLGWTIEVRQTAGPFFWGAGNLDPSKPELPLPE